jgi:hypothetical protein
VSPAIPAGLCDRCAHQRLVRNTRGSAFSLCQRSRTDPGRYPRYPPLPVRRCDGFEARAPAGEDRPAGDGEGPADPAA